MSLGFGTVQFAMDSLPGRSDNRLSENRVNFPYYLPMVTQFFADIDIRSVINFELEGPKDFATLYESSSLFQIRDW